VVVTLPRWGFHTSLSSGVKQLPQTNSKFTPEMDAWNTTVFWFPFWDRLCSGAVDVSFREGITPIRRDPPLINLEDHPMNDHGYFSSPKGRATFRFRMAELHG